MKEFAVVYILDESSQEVYYLRKEKPAFPHLHQKLLGFGGRRENRDEDFHETAIRELEEELHLQVEKNDLIFRGVLWDSKENDLVYIFLLPYEKRLQEGYIKGEGDARYYSYTYHRSHPQDFCSGSLKFLDDLFFSEKKIKVVL